MNNMPQTAAILCVTVLAVFFAQPAIAQSTGNPSATEGTVFEKDNDEEGLVDGQTCYYCDTLDEDPPEGSGVAWDSVGAYEGCEQDAADQQFQEEDDCSVLHEDDPDGYASCYSSAQSSYESASSECDSI